MKRNAADRIVAMWIAGTPRATEALAVMTEQVTRRMTHTGAADAFHTMRTIVSAAHQATEVLK